MRRLLALAAAAALLSGLQVAGLNVSSTTTTFELPLAALLLAAPYLRPAEQLAVALGAALPLDTASVLPFGTYFLALIAVVLAVRLASRRFPVRAHRALLLSMVAGGAVSAAGLISLIAWAARGLRLGLWAPLADPALLVRSVLVLLVNCLLIAGAVIVAGYFLKARLRAPLAHAQR